MYRSLTCCSCSVRILGHSLHNDGWLLHLCDTEHVSCHLPCTDKNGNHPWKRPASRWWQQIPVSSRPRWKQQACRWASLRRFLTVWADFCSSSPYWLVWNYVGCGGPGLVWLHTVIWLVGCTAKFSGMTLQTAYSREMNSHSTGNLQAPTNLWLCCVIKSTSLPLSPPC